jgi:Mrp family chromosome partitioning ATPase
MEKLIPDNEIDLSNGHSSSNRSKSQSLIKQMGEVALLSDDELLKNKILYAGMKDRRVLNVFRELRTTLVQKNKGKNFICMVSSLSGGGGGSYVALNLAAALALDKSKTSLLIDCNLYDPSIDSLLDIGEVDGVTDFIDDSNLEVKDIIYASGISRLRVIPVGSNREAGAEHYSSPRMKQFFSSIKSRYDDRFIVIDAPPILSSAETRILAELCDMAILVLPYGRASQDQISAGVDVFDKDKLAGIVFNN